MVDFSKFESISPYSDEEAVKALAIVAQHPILNGPSKYFFPDEEPDYLKKQLMSVHSVEEFQTMVMAKFVQRVIEMTTTGFTYDGIENLKSVDKFLAMSNHRDIILDPAFTQVVLYNNDVPMTEICVGDNLLSNPIVEMLIRSNRMVKVVRGISARELYLSSQMLSEYIRLSITTGRSSIWLAQRQGRTKNGADMTEQGLLKMVDMSGKGDFVQNYAELNILPMSISYEYEPCDILKAREIYISRRQKYVKAENEDVNSIVTGVQQFKGKVHLHIGAPLTREDIAAAELCDKNDRYQLIRQTVDQRVIEGYKLHPTNYIAYDLVEGTSKYSDHYDISAKEAFQAYVERNLEVVEPEIDRTELRDIFLRIYSNPVVSKENL